MFLDMEFVHKPIYYIVHLALSYSEKAINNYASSSKSICVGALSLAAWAGSSVSVPKIDWTVCQEEVGWLRDNIHSLSNNFF